MMEPRSFAERAPVGEMRPPELFGMTPDERDAALFAMIVQVHTCVEQGQAEAAKSRKALTGKVDRTRRDMKALQDGQRLIMVALGLADPAEGEDRPVANIQTKTKVRIGWWDIGRIVLSILGAIGGLIFVYQAVAVVFPTFHHWMMSLSPT